MYDRMMQIITRIELSAEIARIALGCPTCRNLVRELILNHNSRSVSDPNFSSNSNLDTTGEGGPSTDSSRLAEKVKTKNDYNQEII
jgi:hypothetical protein